MDEQLNVGKALYDAIHRALDTFWPHQESQDHMYQVELFRLGVAEGIRLGVEYPELTQRIAGVLWVPGDKDYVPPLMSDMIASDMSEGRKGRSLEEMKDGYQGRDS